MVMPGHQLNDNAPVDDGIERLIDAYGVRDVMLALARAVKVRGLDSIAGKIRAMLPRQ
jgi:hypothetical protein